MEQKEKSAQELKTLEQVKKAHVSGRIKPALFGS